MGSSARRLKELMISPGTGRRFAEGDASNHWSGWLGLAFQQAAGILEPANGGPHTGLLAVPYHRISGTLEAIVAPISSGGTSP
jgi:hypothetical protein